MAADEVKWCVTASTLESIVNHSSCAFHSYLSLGNQEDGAAYKANPGDKVTYHCRLGV